MATGLAFGERAGAVNLHQHLLASASGAMEAIDVLGDYQFHLTRLLEPHNGLVDDVRLRILFFQRLIFEDFLSFS